LKVPDSDTLVPDVAGLKPLVVLYLKPRVVADAPLIEVIFPFNVTVVAATLVAAFVVTVGAVMHDDVL